MALPKALRPPKPTPPKKRKKAGRHVIGPEVWVEVLKALSIGHLDQDACVLAGIHKDTFYDKIRKDSAFSDEVKKARLKAKDISIKVIRKAAIKTWTAAAWWLERKHRDEFAVKYINDGEQKHVHNFSEKSAKLLKKYTEE